jgi:hypothetical protein
VGDEVISMEAGKQGGGEEAFLSTFNFSKTPAGRLGVQFQPVFPPGTLIKKITVNGLPAKDPGVKETEQGWVIPDFGFWLDSNVVLEIAFEGGITALPFISHPEPGDRSEGLRIINTSYSKGKYSLIAEGLAGKQYEFKVWAAEPEKYKTDRAKITGISGNIISLNITIPDLGMKYERQEVVIAPK